MKLNKYDKMKVEPSHFMVRLDDPVTGGQAFVKGYRIKACLGDKIFMANFSLTLDDLRNLRKEIRKVLKENEGKQYIQK